RPTVVHSSFNLDDVWDGSDFLGRRYDGVLVELPEVSLHDLDGTALATLRAELRLSRLGNHYVRLQTRLVDADPAQVHAALFRAAPEHGTAVVRCDGAETTWPRLAALAVDLAEQVGVNLGGATVSVRPGMFHIVVSPHAASVTRGPSGAGPRWEVRTL